MMKLLIYNVLPQNRVSETITHVKRITINGVVRREELYEP